MAEHSKPVTSEVLARAMDTNPVVIRRIMAGLREQGYVHSEKGHGGGRTLARDLSRVTLRDIYDALGQPALLAMGNRPDVLSSRPSTPRWALPSTTPRLARFGGVKLAMLVAQWGPTTLYLNGQPAPDAQELAALRERGVAIEPAAIAALHGKLPNLSASHWKTGESIPSTRSMSARARASTATSRKNSAAPSRNMRPEPSSAPIP